MNEPTAGGLEISERGRRLPASRIRVMYNLAQETGGDLVRMEVGEPDFDTPAHIVEAASHAAATGETHYTHNNGIAELREAIAGKLRRGAAFTRDPADEILVTTGAIEALYSALALTVDPGEDVVLPTPAWPSYFTQAAALDIELVEVPLAAGDAFALSPQSIRDALTDDTGAIIVNSPSNPTGRALDPDTIREVLDIARKHDVYVIADDVYEDLLYTADGATVSQVADGGEDHLLTVHSASKTYAMTGWRLGWLTGDASVIEAGTRLHQATITCASSVSQHAAVAAITGPQGPVEEMYDAFAERRDFVVDRVREIPGISCPEPDGGFYAFIDVDALPGSSFEIAKRLVTEYGVVTVPGSGFGAAGEGHLRVSFANSLDRLQAGFDTIERMVTDEL